MEKAVEEAGKKGRGDYSYKGTIEVSGTSVTYAPGTTEPKDIMDDLARYLGALYEQEIEEITYGGKDYTWNEEGSLKGSNWENGGKTLVSEIVKDYTTTTTELVLELDGIKVTFSLGN